MDDTPPMLIDPDWLATRLDDPRVVVVEATAHLQPQPVGASRYVSGRAQYETDHIPGAVYLDMRDELSDPQGAYPYTFPTAARIDALFADRGIAAGDHVVIYARGGVMSATRAWFVLQAMDVERLSLLDGGYERWVAEGRPVWRAGDPAPQGRDADERRRRAAAQPFRARPEPRRLADRQRVEQALGDPAVRLVNALSREQFAGTGGAHYGRPGRIPGSVSVPARELLSPQTGRFLAPEALRAVFAAVGVDDGRTAIAYCGGGIAATVDAFALALIGHRDWAVYDDSLLEWSTQPSLPMETG